MYWARYVLVDQAWCGRGMRSIECPSSYIIDSFRESEELPWSPSADYLLSNTVLPPGECAKFFTSLISGKQGCAQLTTKKASLVNFIGQDNCYAVSNGWWKMPKHILLGMTVRHITGSAEVMSIPNHFGHCVSYSTLLELETAMCNHVIESDSLLPVTIDKQRNVVVHLWWDNFDMNEETPSAAGTIIPPMVLWCRKWLELTFLRLRQPHNQKKKKQN